MGEGRVEYVHMPAGSELPIISPEPRRLIILIDQDVSDDWRKAVSNWIVDSGCLYMMAWGHKCILWDDSVDHATLARFDYGEVPDDNFVMTTWHEGEPLHAVFFYARVCASHPTIELPVLTIIDVRTEERKSAIMALYEAEASGLLVDASNDPRDLPFRKRLKLLMRMQ